MAAASSRQYLLQTLELRRGRHQDRHLSVSTLIHQIHQAHHLLVGSTITHSWRQGRRRVSRWIICLKVSGTRIIHII